MINWPVFFVLPGLHTVASAAEVADCAGTESHTDGGWS